ncbi:hypothetical protein BGX27_000252 [Mortierella sp. AM989]|nr:hypothetical protein BGX27_000252 [Mortierella sp. AM989]
MSFRLPSSIFRCQRPGRSQSATHLPQFNYTITSSFTTSYTALSRGWREPRSHNSDIWRTKRIKRKAKKSLFTDSASAKTVAGRITRHSGTSPTTQTIEAEITNHVIPPKATENIKYENYSRLGNKQTNSKSSRNEREHYSQQEQIPYDRTYENASRLRYEDLVGSRQHRQHHLYRMRLLHYMRQHQFQKHQQRYQSHSRGPDGGPESNHHQGNFNSWWIWHLIESRKIIIRSILSGITVSSVAIWIYNTRSHNLQQWNAFVSDVVRIRNDLEDIIGESKVMPSIQQYFNYSKSPISSSASLLPGDMIKESFNPKSLYDSHGTGKNLKMLTPEQVELRLGNRQKSFYIGDRVTKRTKRESTLNQNLIQGYSTNQLPSNSAIEDDLSQHVVRGENGEIERIFFGVFDGHSGWCCSQKVARELAPSVANELDLLRNPKDSKAVIEAIERGFLKLDQRIVHDTVRRVLEHPSRPLACSSLLPAISGSCALMAYIDPRGGDLYVASVGDSRAVMGVREPLAGGGHVWRAVPLSFDQTGRNRWEVKRLKEEHPGEEDTVVMRGRVLGGLEPTRAFGDARYKWSKETQEKVFHLFPAYRQIYRNFKTPPYVTAKPVVRHHKIQPEDRFLVMATDGLWDKLTSDEVVQLVGDLLDGKVGHEEMTLDKETIRKYKLQRRQVIQASSSATSDNVVGEQQEEEEELTPPNTTAKGPARQIRKFTYRDQANASTHLIRNALGGADDDKLAATLSIPSPMSRVYRDDITVTVIFFGQQDTTIALSEAENVDGLVEIQ